jgi:hypothetical protein
MTRRLGGHLDLPDCPNDQASRSRLRGGVSAAATGRMLRFSLQSLPSGGVGITRTGTWGVADGGLGAKRSADV